LLPVVDNCVSGVRNLLPVVDNPLSVVGNLLSGVRNLLPVAGNLNQVAHSRKHIFSFLSALVGRSASNRVCEVE
jgi:hypothetical protein